jgi:4-amino-4-deoxy-L-arabinose transferase-like glycosyltransferase
VSPTIESAISLSSIPLSGTRATGAVRAIVLVLIVLAIVALWFAKATSRQLTHADEGRYAEIPREMAVSGDFVTPRLNGFKYFEKPPLQYWSTALAYRAFGVTEWTARLWTGVTGLLAVLATWYAGRRLFNARAGLFGALALLASPYFVVMSSANSLDMGVSAFLSCAVLAYLLSRQAPPGKARRPWMLAAWACMALAVLSKGLIGVVLPLGALVGYTLLERDLRAWRDLHWLPGVALFLLITAPWFVLVARANPEFLHFFFIHEHFQRFASKAHDRAGPVWYFLPLLLAAASPWVPALLDAVRTAWRARPAAEAVSPARFLCAWAAVVFVFFSVSGSKLPGYILPIIPALALLAGEALARVEGLRATRWLAAGALIVSAILFTAVEVLEHLDHGPLNPAYLGFAEWTEPGTFLLVMAGGVGAYWAGRMASDRLVVALLVAFYGAATIGVTGYSVFAPGRSAHAFAETIRAAAPGVPVYSVRNYDQTLPVYLGRTVTLVDFIGEFDLGIKSEPERYVASLDAFRARWDADRDAFAIVTRESLPSLQQTGILYDVVAEDPKRLLIRKRR